MKDEKLSQAEKSEIQVLVSEGKIAWVVGLRIDDRFKFDENTKEVYVLRQTTHHSSFIKKLITAP